jgi:hypothetical protein
VNHPHQATDTVTTDTDWRSYVLQHCCSHSVTAGWSPKNKA